MTHMSDPDCEKRIFQSRRWKAYISTRDKNLEAIKAHLFMSIKAYLFVFSSMRVNCNSGIPCLATTVQYLLIESTRW